MAYYWMVAVGNRPHTETLSIGDILLELGNAGFFDLSPVYGLYFL